jgi:WD40 repeat protein
VGDRAVVWEAPAGTFLTPVAGHLAPVWGVRFAADGREVVTLGGDGRVLRWDSATGKPAGEIPVTGSDPDRLTHLAPGGDRGLRNSTVYGVKEGADLFALPLAYPTPSADFARVAGFRTSTDGKTPTVCEVWDLNTRRKVVGVELPADAATTGALAAAFSPDGTRLVTAVRTRDRATGGNPLLVAGWDVKTGKQFAEFAEPRGYGRAQLAVAGNTSCVLATDDTLWAADYEGGRQGFVIDESPVPGAMFVAPTFSPDGTRLAAGVPTKDGRGYAVRVYDWPRGKALHTFAGHPGAVTALAFSPDGKTLASACHDGTVLLWDLAAIPK